MAPEGIMQQTKNVQSCTFCCWACIFALHSFLRVWKGKKRKREKRAMYHISAGDVRAFIWFFSPALTSLQCRLHSHHCLHCFSIFTHLRASNSPQLCRPRGGVCLDSAAVTQSRATVAHTLHHLLKLYILRCE